MTSVDGEHDPSRVPSPVGPNLPVSQLVDKVFTERQGRGGGFAKTKGGGSSKIDPSRLLDNLNEAGTAMGLPSVGATAAMAVPTMTPLDLGLRAQAAFRSFGVFCHGFLAGLAFWQLIMVRKIDLAVLYVFNRLASLPRSHIVRCTSCPSPN